MLSLIICFYLWSNMFVLAPPLSNINHLQSLENRTSMPVYPKLLRKRQPKLKTNLTTTRMISNQFDMKSYRSSWKFVDKNTIRVRFRLSEKFFKSISSSHFIVHHLQSGSIQTYNDPPEIINSTLTLYLQNIKHGRHIVCLLLYRSKLMINPKHIFCQDIIFNYQKYGHHDMDIDEYGNTFVFLLTQYSIVLGLLCLLQLVHAARKRKFLRTVYDKANGLRTLVMEYHNRLQDNKTTTDSNSQTHTLEYLIYHLNRNALYDFDQIHNPSKTNDEILNYEKHLKVPRRLSKHSISPLLIERRRSLVMTENKNFESDEEIFDQTDLDTRSYEEQSTSFKSVSHILEENKPWVTKLSDNGSIKHSIISSEPL